MRALRLLVLLTACNTLPTTQDASTNDASDDGLVDAPTTVDASDASDAAADAGPMCEAGTAFCSGQCVPLSTTTNCSACGQACAAGATCTNGACSMQVFINVGSGTEFLAGNATALFYQIGLESNATLEQLSMDGGTPGTFEQGVWSPALFIADSNNAYYAQNYIGNGNSFAVVQHALDGGSKQPLASPASQISALARNSATVFYATNNEGKIWSVPIGGSSATPILSNQAGMLDRLVADDNNVYWTSSSVDGGAIAQATITGANAVALASVTGVVTSIVVDSTTVYFAIYKDGIYAVPIGGGATTRLGNYGRQLQIDATNLYFVQDDPIYARQDVVRMAKSGGTQVVIAADSLTYPIQPQLTALGPTMFFAWASSGTNTVILATPK